MADQNIRLAVVDKDRCKPSKCKRECKTHCPIVRSGKDCIRVTEKIALISETLCIGCGACVRACPFHAIQIINLPRSLDSETIHRYGRNGFKLHRLPQPRYKQVLGLVGQNGIGKSTALQIIANKLRPNLGILDPKKQPDWTEIIQKFRGSEIQTYLTKLINDQMRVILKPQYVDNIAKVSKQKVGVLLNAKDSRGNSKQVIEELELGALLERNLPQLSGGELQRFAIALICIQKAGAYFFDEPSSYLDIGQRMRAARVIRDCLNEADYVIAIEHDLAILDYMSDFISVLYGSPGAYGVITAPFTVREGINIFLAGYIPTENMRFRKEELVFRITDDEDLPQMENESHQFTYPHMKLTLGDFSLEVDRGNFRNGEIIVLLGRNGVGKTTLIRMLARQKVPDEMDFEVPELSVSYKPQKIQPRFEGTVEQLLTAKILQAMSQNLFKEMVMMPLNLEYLMDRKVKKLSGGELQRVAIALALGANADLYLIDEPSAYLDAEQRVVIAKIIKRYIMNTGKTAFVVEHDFVMATYLANRVLVFDGQPGVSTIAREPQSLVKGMNYFLRQMEVTLRSDPTTHRPRINKYNSVKDRTQKQNGTYFVIE
ncbi:ABC transporter E family member 2 [Histomonas meleagridis]|uniref:ABC transporter E family member 2 n=1 Tax=Histomonas meleagridis TaxID=135588 RepID=UPI00355A87BF|nr:ABC transporter E family member 2 [Histomonas meleagridis]KAH0799138.1 ABC transporter E family member 2 [Histomonas meleagridis]